MDEEKNPTPFPPNPQHFPCTAWLFSPCCPLGPGGPWSPFRPAGPSGPGSPGSPLTNWEGPGGPGTPGRPVGIRGTTDQFHCQHMRSRNSFRRRVQNEKQSKWNVLRCKIIIKNTSNRILTRHTCICTSLLFHLKSQILETGTDVGVISTNRPPSSGLPDNHLWPSLEHYLLVKLILSQVSCF